MRLIRVKYDNDIILTLNEALIMEKMGLNKKGIRKLRHNAGGLFSVMNE